MCSLGLHRVWGLGLLECSIDFASRFGKMGHGGYWSTFHLGTASLDVGIRVRVRAVDDEMLTTPRGG